MTTTKSQPRNMVKTKDLNYHNTKDIQTSLNCKDQSPIVGTVARLDNEISSLASALDELENRLNLVLKPWPTSASLDTNSQDKVQCAPLQDSINESANHVHANIDKIYSILDRLSI